MRLLDGLITRLLDGPLEALVTKKVDERVDALKLDALYRHRWHGDASRLRIHETAVVNNALFNVSGGTITTSPGPTTRWFSPSENVPSPSSTKNSSAYGCL